MRSHGGLEDVLAECEALGWAVSQTSGNRLRLAHPAVRAVVHTGPNPRDRHAPRNLLATVRRLSREAGILPRAADPPEASGRPSSAAAIPPPRRPPSSPRGVSPATLSLAVPPSVQRGRGYAGLEEFAAALRRREEVAAWALYAARLLATGRPDRWLLVRSARARFAGDAAARQRVVAAARAAEPGELGRLRARLRGLATPPIASAPEIPDAPGPAEAVRAWAHAVLRMRLGGAPWSAIRRNRDLFRGDTVFRQRVLDACRGVSAGALSALRASLRAGAGLRRAAIRAGEGGPKDGVSPAVETPGRPPPRVPAHVQPVLATPAKTTPRAEARNAFRDDVLA